MLVWDLRARSRPEKEILRSSLGWQCCQERREGQTLEHVDIGQDKAQSEIILTKRAWAESQEKARREEPWKGCDWWPQMQQKPGRRGGGGRRED